MPSTPKARIYQPAKTAMQSGRAKTRQWLLEYDPAPKQIDPLIGWTGSASTVQQIRMKFPNKEAAIAFAVEEAIPYAVEETHTRTPKRKSYSENFAFNRVETYNPPKA